LPPWLSNASERSSAKLPGSALYIEAARCQVHVSAGLASPVVDHQDALKMVVLMLNGDRE
jgi:hypothetical protein